MTTNVSADAVPALAAATVRSEGDRAGVPASTPGPPPFRFYDNRQKYLAFVNTCNEKAAISARASHELGLLHPSPPSFRLFDAGMGDATVLETTGGGRVVSSPAVSVRCTPTEQQAVRLRGSGLGCAGHPPQGAHGWPPQASGCRGGQGPVGAVQPGTVGRRGGRGRGGRRTRGPLGCFSFSFDHDLFFFHFLLS